MLVNSKNDIVLNQSAGNRLGTSEAIRAGSSWKKEEILEKDLEYVAGVIDGDGNFDIRLNKQGVRVLKSIRLKMHSRDIEVLKRVRNILGCGSIKSYSLMSLYSISKKVEMQKVVELLNGHIRLKVPNFVEACKGYKIEFKEANYNIVENSPYLSGLIDTDGSVYFDYSGNKIMLALEFQKIIYTEKLNFDKTICGVYPKVYKLIKHNQTKEKEFYSIRFVFCPKVSSMVHVYNFIMKSRNYSDFKFYRITQIKNFIEIRNFKNSPKGSEEHRIYSKWVFNFITHLDPGYTKKSYLKNLTL